MVWTDLVVVSWLCSETDVNVACNYGKLTVVACFAAEQ